MHPAHLQFHGEKARWPDGTHLHYSMRFIVGYRQGQAYQREDLRWKEGRSLAEENRTG